MYLTSPVLHIMRPDLQCLREACECVCVCVCSHHMMKADWNIINQNMTWKRAPLTHCVKMLSVSWVICLFVFVWCLYIVCRRTCTGGRCSFLRVENTVWALSMLSAKCFYPWWHYCLIIVWWPAPALGTDGNWWLEILSICHEIQWPQVQMQNQEEPLLFS